MAKDRTLSNDDRILWGKIARTTRPLPGRQADLEAFEAEIRANDVAKDEQKAARTGSAGKTEQPGFALTAPASPKQKQHHPLERPVKRKIAKGHLALEARIDLHGMIQSEAHGFLLGFLMRAHDRGLRHVLVITGKGGSLGSDGALKRAVPLWFALPEFRGLISSFETAARNHGGEGALYVRLSKTSGTRR